MSKKITVTVTQEVAVTLNEEAFSHEFMEEFRKNFFPLYELSDHAQHIAQLIARGIYDEVVLDHDGKQFFEGYAEIGPFVEEARIVTCVTETENV